MVDSTRAGTLEKLINDGWDYHDKESERLARELEAAAAAGMQTVLSIRDGNAAVPGDVKHPAVTTLTDLLF